MVSAVKRERGRPRPGKRKRYASCIDSTSGQAVDDEFVRFPGDVYLKELYDGRRPSLGRVFAFYSERDRKGGSALGAGVGGANRAR